MGPLELGAIDDTYLAERAHLRRYTPKGGEEDNPKDHASLSLCNLRRAVAEASRVETGSRHENPILYDYHQPP